MLQLLQNLGSGQTELAPVPAPGPQAGHILIQTTRSLVSLGTERMLVEFGRANWLNKARQQPEKVRAVLQKVRSDGLLATFSAVRSKLSQPIPLGYCQVGRVIDAGNTSGVTKGDRVISNGPHAEVVSVRASLVVKIPPAVSDEQAAFTPLAAIALQGIGLLAPQAGDRVVVTGLGLIGQLAVQILLAKGCRVFGVDPDSVKCAMAAQAGADVFVLAKDTDPVAAGLAWSQGQGVAGVLITASTSSDQPVNQAARLCRPRGRVVLVGVVGLHLNRADFYRHEISFQVSNSYGNRESTGAGSAHENFEQVLRWIAEGDLKVGPLISSRASFAAAPEVYADLNQARALGVILEYAPAEAAFARQIKFERPAISGLGVTVMGAGNFTTRTLLPALTGLKKPPVLRSIVSAQGATAYFAAQKFGATEAGTDISTALADPAAEAVFITTRHHQHAAQAIAALQAGKNVWVEKPLALSLSEVEAVAQAARRSGKILMVGFNRRFAPLAVHVRRTLDRCVGPKQFKININAGNLPADHWTLPSAVGGGRIVGEACHFIDLLRFLTASPIRVVQCRTRGTDGQDAGCYTLTFENGDTGEINYLTNQPAHLPKESIEVSGKDWTIHLDNWQAVRATGLTGVNSRRWFAAPDKGHTQALETFLEGIATGTAPIPLEQIIEVSEWAVKMQEMVESDRYSVS